MYEQIEKHLRSLQSLEQDIKVQVGKDQEKAQLERDSHSKNRGGRRVVVVRDRKIQTDCKQSLRLGKIRALNGCTGRLFRAATRHNLRIGKIRALNGCTGRLFRAATDVFTSMITSKLPKEALIQLEIQKGATKKWTVKELRKLLKHNVAARERAEQQYFPAKAKPSGETYKPMVMVSSAEALMARAQSVNNRNKEKPTFSTRCRFCDGYHWSDECPK